MYILFISPLQSPLSSKEELEILEYRDIEGRWSGRRSVEST